MARLASARPPAPRPHRRGVAAVVAVLSLLACGGLLAPAPALAQAQLAFPQRPPPPPKSKIAIEREKSGQKQMLVQAREIDYDYVNHRVAAVGNVQIYYGGSTPQAVWINKPRTMDQHVCAPVDPEPGERVARPTVWRSALAGRTLDGEVSASSPASAKEGELAAAH